MCTILRVAVRGIGYFLQFIVHSRVPLRFKNLCRPLRGRSLIDDFSYAPYQFTFTHPRDFVAHNYDLWRRTGFVRVVFARLFR